MPAGVEARCIGTWACPVLGCAVDGQQSSHDPEGTSLAAHLRIVHRMRPDLTDLEPGEGR